MKKDLAKYFGFYQSLDLSLKNEVEDVVFDVVESDLDRVLKEIFSVDPRSGLPNGDIVYWLSNDGNTAVKDWLMNNLLKPRATSSGSSLEGVTDDLIAEMSRGRDESLDDYIVRLDAIRNEAFNNEEINKDGRSD